MFMEHIATGNGIPCGKTLWSQADATKRRQEYARMIELGIYIPSKLFPIKEGMLFEKESGALMTSQDHR